MPVFTSLFLLAVTLAFLVRIWLARRHISHVSAHRNRVPDGFSSQISLESHQKAADYTCTKTRLEYISVCLETAVLLILTLGGGLNALAGFWMGWSSHSILSGVMLIASTALLMTAVGLPLSYYRIFVVERQFGFNNMTPSMFFADLAKRTVLSLFLGIPLLFGVLFLMEQMGANWWFYVWLAWMAFNLVILAVYPTWIAPIFNKFTPLEDASLKTRIEQLMRKCGFKSSGLFVMDGSRRSRHGNAYFTG
ncbi:MAG: M48 family metallopeptidase, partial [Bacteroidota bacterium]|nr:M48 family metallopeptidase [Bacteroidota bacterium]